MLEVDVSKVEEPIKLKVKGQLEDIARELVNEMKIEAPTDTGRLKQSIQIIGSAEDKLYVGTSVKYAAYIQFGTRPHYPPIQPLKKWVRRKLNAEESVAYAVQRKIGAKGTEPNPFVDRAIEKVRRKFT